MSGITICPQCGTRFRVTAEQLAARNGAVRCGRCAHVFDAYRSMAQQPASVSPEAPEEIEITAPDAAEYPEQAPPEQPGEAEPAPQMAPEQAQEPVQSGEAEAEAAAEDSPANAVRVVRVEPAPQKIESSVSPDNPKYAPPPKPRRTWPWALASLLLAFALAGQGTYFFRDSVAANYPATRPLLEQACTYLQCHVGLPQKPELIGIDSSELHGDPAHANIVVLNCVLRNRAAHVQAFPELELTLTNPRDEMVARRVFAPKEYLANASVIPQGIAAKGDVAIRLLMDLGDLKAEGYKLYVFYPS